LYINAVSSNIVAHLSLKLILYSKPYNVSWVNNIFIAANETCLFPIKFLDYHDEIWCDVILMNIGHIILDRSLIYDLIRGITSCRSNSRVLSLL